MNMPKTREGAAPLSPTGKVKILLTLTPKEGAAVDRARGTIPAATWCRDAVVRAAE
jgi:hypothetical protein